MVISGSGHMGFCECACQWWYKDGMHQPTLQRKSRLLLSFGNIWKQYYSDQLGHLLHLAANGWTPQSLPTWALPDRTECLSDTLQGEQGQVLRWEATSGSSLVLSKCV